MNSVKKRSIESISLVLGSGGARGLAHIGVLQAIEARGLTVASISGCSIGALVGGVYAMGKLDDFRQWVCALEKFDVVRLLDFNFGSSGLIKGERIIGVLKDLIGEADIQDLSIRYTAVATDLDRQREVWISQGPLFDAIRASIAIPTIFTPHKLNGRILVDGGLLNPVPIGPTLHDQSDATLAVNLAGLPDSKLERDQDDTPRKRDRLHPKIAAFIDDLSEKFSSRDESESSERELGLQDIVSRSFDTMQNTVTRMKLAASTPDLIIDVPRNACQTHQFYRARQVIDLGRHCAEQALDRFLDSEVHSEP